MQIVEGKQPQSEHFPGAEQVANVGSGESSDMRVGGFAERAGVLGVDEVFDVKGAVEREGHAVAGHPGGHHAVEHVDSAGDHFQNLRGGAEAHRVAGFVVWQEGHGIFDRAEHLMLGLADRYTADRVAIEVHRHELAGGLLAEVGVD